MDGIRVVSRWKGFWLACMALAFGGCTSLQDYVHNGFKVGPEYGGSQAFVSQHWINDTDMRVRSEEPDLSQWWTNLNDPMLNRLIQTAYAQNLTVRQAGFRVLEARYLLAVATGELFPQLQEMDGSYRRFGNNYNMIFSDQWNAGFSLGWELDIWGRIRRGIAAADERLNQSVASYDDVIVTLLADVATNYTTIRTLQTQLKYTKENIRLQRESLNIAERRFEAGRTSELDVAQAKSTLAQTESDVPQIEMNIRQACNRLCVLLGLPAGDLEKQLGAAEIPTAPPEIIVGIPADLLRRRPDIRLAEHRVAEQAELIGIAETDLYPIFTLNGTMGYTAANFSQLFNNSSFNGSVGPSFRWNLLHYGRILNSIRYEEAKFRELTVAYQQTVLNANSEVENALITYLNAHDRSKFLDESVFNAQKAVNIVLKQYEVGTVDFNRVSLIQQNLVQQQNLAAQAKGQIALGAIQTYRTLGGGWEVRGDPPVIEAATAEELPQNNAMNGGDDGPAPEPVNSPDPE